MSLEDPFFVVKDEVFKALNKTRGLYLRWRELGESGGTEAEWTTTELRNSLRSIEWDLEDLEDTISIVEKNPSKFRIDNRELSSRRHFIDNTRDEVKQMKDKMSLNRSRDRDITAHQPLLDNDRQSPNHNHSIAIPNSNSNSNEYHQHPHNDRTYLVECPNGNSLINSGSQAVANTIAGTMSAAAAAASRHSGTKYSKLENALDSPSHYGQTHHGGMDSPSHRYVGETVSIQQRMIQGQDEQLDMISDSIGTLKTVSRQIGVELDEQAVMLDDFGNEFDTTESKLDTTMKKVAKVLHMNNDKRQWAAILILSGLLLFVIILFIIL
ncbi:syntaxin-10 isoform X1 [Drosophila subpulchrella]|uniref:syntaxin-10 isoform X1 n=2 Tax=Drosophila subpulchrella TaxID=1486046 RepID=UPI0018A194C4|nr:syntaxin-10 isoform X1 [Drosophila subpulchrella]